MDKKDIKEKLAQAEAMLDESQTEYLECMEKHPGDSTEDKNLRKGYYHKMNMCLKHWKQLLRADVRGDEPNFLEQVREIDGRCNKISEEMAVLIRRRDEIAGELADAIVEKIDRKEISERFEKANNELTRHKIVSAREFVRQRVYFEERAICFPRSIKPDSMEMYEVETALKQALHDRGEHFGKEKWKGLDWLLDLNRALLVYRTVKQGSSTNLKEISCQFKSGARATDEQQRMVKPIKEALSILEAAPRTLRKIYGIR